MMAKEAPKLPKGDSDWVRTADAEVEATATITPEDIASTGHGACEESVRRRETDAGMTEERRVTSDAENCDACLEAADRGWVPIGTLPPIGSLTCLANCLCHFEYRDALTAAAERLDKLPLLDRSDGSKSWYQMNHEEGVLTDADGTILEHVRSEEDGPGKINYDPRSLRAALDGGLIMHSHVQEVGCSFGDVDLSLALCSSKSSKGVLMVVSANHPIDDKWHDVRYTVDTRAMAKLPVGLPRKELEAIWNRHEVSAKTGLANLADDTNISNEELYAEQVHRTVKGVCDEIGVRYEREIVR